MPEKDFSIYTYIHTKHFLKISAGGPREAPKDISLRGTKRPENTASKKL